MEKNAFTARNAMMILCVVVVIIAMFLNWYPVELDLGVLRFEDLVGKINAFTLLGMVLEIEDSLGMLAELLPEGFAALKIWSIVLTVLGSVTVALYIGAIVLNLLKKHKFIDLVSVAAAAGAIVTAILFKKVVNEMYSAAGATAAGYNAMTVLLKSPWIAALIGAVATVICTDAVGTAVVGWMVAMEEGIRNFIAYIAEWIKVLVDNIGFVVSDIAGAFVGIWIGKLVADMSGMVFLGVIAGMAAAGLIAAICCCAVGKVMIKKN